MYRFVSEIHNDQGSSRIPDVAFHPNGHMFAVSYQQNNQVRVYDSSTLSLLRTYRNPEARLDLPHGVTMTNRHIIVSNKLNCNPRPPSILNVYRIGDPSVEPLTVFTTPVKYLSEAHSFAVHNGRLLVTYSGTTINVAIVSYRFDDEEGKISGPTSIDSWFAVHGTPKGLCFNEEGTKVITTMMRANLNEPEGYINKFLRGKFSRMTEEFVLSKFAVKLCVSLKYFTGVENGVAIFDVDEDGVLSKVPVQTLLGSQFSRPENVSIAKGSCAIANAINDTVNLYNFDGDHFPNSPVQVIRDHLSFPHDACLSPDKKMLVVANHGLDVINGKAQWRSFRQPRSDKLTIFELQK